MDFITKIRIYDKNGFVLGIGSSINLEDGTFSLCDNNIGYSGFTEWIDKIETLVINQKSEIIMSHIVDFSEFAKYAK